MTPYLDQFARRWLASSRRGGHTFSFIRRYNRAVALRNARRELRDAWRRLFGPRDAGLTLQAYVLMDIVVYSLRHRTTISAAGVHILNVRGVVGVPQWSPVEIDSVALRTAVSVQEIKTGIYYMKRAGRRLTPPKTT